MAKPEAPVPSVGIDPLLPYPPRPMAVRCREWVVDWWGGGGGSFGRMLRLLTLPLEVGFRRASGFRNRLYDRGFLPLQRAPIPVISVGNLTVGGSGKTPFSAWLTERLRARGEKPALVAHGYGQDEMVLHRRWNPDCLVLAEEDRAFGVWKAAKKGATVAVLDDGFQHRRLARDLDIVLVASNTPADIRLLPRGPFREPLSALSRAALVIVTRKGQSQPTLGVENLLASHVREAPVQLTFVPRGWTDLEGEPTPSPSGSYLAVCGIGDPEGFTRMLSESLGRPGEPFCFPDHHDYSWGDVNEIKRRAAGRTLVTTEKDAVKLHAFREDLSGLRVLHLGIEFTAGEERLWEQVGAVLKSRGGPP